ncbi:hypothetical protein SAMN04487947_2736 [Halogeometricum rufum]|uniref:DUF7979 domain-containing protein n=1 Tax=Halogeometricum rufum TaxID=553469 RepID=A0A1I6I1A4_9EURY|nr:hypothetical protein [Halogeometricum rufum]SFR60429.1 hypothetical protein SAMN04487947_2736 [Halogeometricum rufum]
MSRTACEPTYGDAADGVTVVRTGAEDIDPTARVWHYDELSDRTQTAIAAAVDGSKRGVCAPELSVGDVVRYTGYYELH